MPGGGSETEVSSASALSLKGEGRSKAKQRVDLPGWFLPFLFVIGLSALLGPSGSFCDESDETCGIRKIYVKYKKPLESCSNTHSDACTYGHGDESRVPCANGKGFPWRFDCSGNLVGINTGYPCADSHCFSLNEDPDIIVTHPNKRCPGDMYWYCDDCVQPQLPEEECDCESNLPMICPGEPINLLKGNMVHKIPLFSTALPGPEFGVTLTYNSIDRKVFSTGYGWHHNFDFSFGLPEQPAFPAEHPCSDLSKCPSIGRFSVGRTGKVGFFVFIPDEFQLRYWSQMCEDGPCPLSFGDAFVPVNTKGITISGGCPGDGGGCEVKIIDKEGIAYNINADGKLEGITDTTGTTLALYYNGSGFLERVDHPLGRSIRFFYENDRLTEVRDHEGNSYFLQYDGVNLQSVDFPDLRRLSFAYDDPYDPHNLTAIRDGEDVTIVFWSYTQDDLAASSSRFNGSEYVTVSYPDRFRAISSGDIIMTNARGRSTTYHFKTLDTQQPPKPGTGRRVIDQMAGPGCSSCGSGGKVSFVYDSHGYPWEIMSRVDETTAQVTRHEDYDRLPDRGDFRTIIKGYGSVDECVVHYTFHPSAPVSLSERKESVLQPGAYKEIIFDYDTDGDEEYNEDPTGNMNRLVEKGYTRDVDGNMVLVEYNTTYQYNTRGQILSADGPRNDVNDVTTYAYYPDDPAEGNDRGLLREMISALGQTTTYGDYDAGGRAGYIIEPNHLTTRYTYDVRGRVRTITFEGAGPQSEDLIIENVYNNDGNLDYICVPGGGVIDYESDPNGRILSITRRVGPTIQSAPIDSITYTYDSEGNKTEETLRQGGPTGAPKKSTAFGYDDYNRLWKLIHADGSFQEYGYDGIGNRTSAVDEDQRVTGYLFDALNRLRAVRAPGSVTTTYGYDSHDNLTHVKNAAGVETRYEYDDFGRLLKVDSAYSGANEYRYDEAGNLIYKKDGNGIITSYTYDALDRLCSVDVPGAEQDITYSYDSQQAMNGIGRLTGITDQSGTTTFHFDKRGNIMLEQRRLDGHTFAMEYDYDKDGNLWKVRYPSGREITGEYNSVGQVINLKGLKGGTTITYAQGPGGGNIEHYPFGAIKTFETGNGITTTLTRDDDYQLTDIVAGNVLNRQYGYGDSGTIQSISSFPLPSWVLADELITYAYEDENNHLTGSTNGIARNYTYDGAGNVQTEHINGTTCSYSYNYHRRLKSVEENSTVIGEYVYDALGRRIKKTSEGRTTYYVYDLAGRLIEECDGNGNWQKDYLYLNGRPLAMIVAGSPEEIYYYHNDPLGTPQKMTDSAGAVVWEAAYSAFGKAEVDEDPDDDGISVTNNLRFPGQYYDAETGLHYNWWRYYDAEAGRYLRPDPTHYFYGNSDRVPFLAPNLLKTPSELHDYVYGQNNPIINSDPRGLAGCGPGSGLLERLIPDYPMGYNFADCCDEHDDCYGCEGKRIGRNKRDCDQAFCKCLVDVCLRSGGFGNVYRPCPSLTYCFFVKRLGGSAFHNARKCCP